MSGRGSATGLTEEDIVEVVGEGVSSLFDADNDTGVRLESAVGADEDVIEFVVNGEVVGTFSDGTLSINDNDTPNGFPRILFGNSAPGGNFATIGHNNGALFLSGAGSGTPQMLLNDGDTIDVISFTTFQDNTEFQDSSVYVNGADIVMGPGSVVEADVGSLAEPSVAVGDDNSGLYSPGNNQLGLVAGGNEIIRIEGVGGGYSAVFDLGNDGIATLGNVNDACVFKTVNSTGKDWCNHQIGTSGSAFIALKKSGGAIGATTPLSDGSKIGAVGFIADNGEPDPAPPGSPGYVGAELQAFAVGTQDADEGGAEMRAVVTEQGTQTPITSQIWTDDGDIILPEYPETRKDGLTSKALYTGPNGEVLHDSIRQLMSFRQSGRIYKYNDERWICVHDDLYNDNYYQMVENANTGTDPLLEWEHQGIMVSPGDTFKRFMMHMRTNNAGQVPDIEIAMYFRKALTQDAYFTTGVDNDNEMDNTEIFRTTFRGDTGNLWDQPNPTGGNTQDHFRRTASMDYTFDDYGFLTMYVKNTGNATATRYVYGTWQHDIMSGYDFG